MAKSSAQRAESSAKLARPPARSRDRLSVSGPIYRDPWAKREAWRKSPIFSNRAMFRNLFPGFGIAVVAFTGYVIYDNNFAKKDAPHH